MNVQGLHRGASGKAEAAFLQAHPGGRPELRPQRAVLQLLAACSFGAAAACPQGPVNLSRTGFHFSLTLTQL